MSPRRRALAGLLVAAAGLSVRGFLAETTYLNPDEILLSAAGPRTLFVSAATGDHPPLFPALIWAVSHVSRSELALRSLPIVAGVLFPWVFGHWLASRWSPRAGLVAQLLLTFSPNLVALSAQVRGYTLLLLFASASLWWLDRAWSSGSRRSLVVSLLCLHLAILTEYSAAWFVGGLFVYSAVRWRSVRRDVMAVWAIGQAGALGLYAGLLSLAPPVSQATRDDWRSSYFAGAFPAAGQNLLAFGAIGSFKQFAYFASSVTLGVVFLVLFIVGLARLLRSRVPGGQGDRREGAALAALWLTPFVLALIGALLFIHPYGRSRHTVILDLFIAAGVAIGLERLRGSRWVTTAVAVVLIPCWFAIATPDQNNIAFSRDRLTSIRRAVAYLRTAIPRGAVIVTDAETSLELRYYAGGDISADDRTADGIDVAPVGSWRAGWLGWDFGPAEQYQTTVAGICRALECRAGDEIWVIDGGFDIGIDRRLRRLDPAAPILDQRSFDDALVVFTQPAAAPH